MNIHEYQAKNILKTFGVVIQEGVVVDRIEDTLDAAKTLKKDYPNSFLKIGVQFVCASL